MLGPLTSSRPSLSGAEILAGLLVDDLRGHARNGMADRAGLVADLPVVAELDVRTVDGDDRRHFRAAVALEQIDAVLLLELGAERLAQLLGADDRVFEMRELLLRDPAHVRRAERRRADQHRRLVGLRDFPDGLRVHRVRVEDDGRALEQRQPHRPGEAERVEERQDADEHVVVQCRKGLRQRVDVGEHVGVREHHALGHARAAAREDDRRQIRPVASRRGP